MSELSVNLNTASSVENADRTKVSTDESRCEQASMEVLLMQRIVERDEAAMAELFEQHGEPLARLIGRLTGWSPDSDDIFQEVLLKVWQSAGSFKGDGSLEGWLRRIAVNRCRNHFRSLSVFRRLVERVGLMRQSGSIEKPVYSEEPNTELQVGLQRLTQQDRTALVLFYLEELPGAEVAEAIGVKPETLHVRLHRARRKLKQILESNDSARG